MIVWRLEGKWEMNGNKFEIYKLDERNEKYHLDMQEYLSLVEFSKLFSFPIHSLVHPYNKVLLVNLLKVAKFHLDLHVAAKKGFK